MHAIVKVTLQRMRLHVGYCNCHRGYCRRYSTVVCRRLYSPFPGTDSWICSKLFSILGVMVMVRVRVSVTVSVSVNRITIRMGTENRAFIHVYLSVLGGK